MQLSKIDQAQKKRQILKTRTEDTLLENLILWYETPFHYQILTLTTLKSVCYIHFLYTSKYLDREYFYNNM